MKLSFSDKELEVLRMVSEVSTSMGIESYAIGGFVRDKFLGRNSPDIDVVCVGDGIMLAMAVADCMRPVPKVAVYKRFGTAMLRFEDLELEFVGARKESYSEDSRKPSVSPGTLQDDLLRRDFTINAMGVSLGGESFGELLDPFGGLQDLRDGIIRTPADPDVTFSDDPLRMMRAIRFASQLNIEIEAKTFRAIQRNTRRMQIVSMERVIVELNKIVMSAKPSIGFSLLLDSGLLSIVFPEMARLIGVDVVNGKGHKDVFYHTLEVLDNICAATDNLWLRWAAILHDIGKPRTKSFEEGHGWTFHGHEAVGANMVPKIFRKLKLPLDERMKYVEKLVRLHLRPIALTKEEISDSALRRLLFDAGEDIDDLLKLCHADVTTKNDYKKKTYRENYKLVKKRLQEVEERDMIRNWQPPIDGALIMDTFDIAPSRQVGTIKDAIREAILDGKIPNDYYVAFQYMLDLGRELGLAPVSTSSSSGHVPDGESCES